MRSALKAGLIYFALVFAAGFVLGTGRVLLLAPAAGEIAAVLIELPIMLAISWFACGWVIRRHSDPRLLGARAITGAAAFVLLMLAELALAIFVFGRSVDVFLGSFETPAGAIGLAGQIAFAIFPLLQLRRK